MKMNMHGTSNGEPPRYWSLSPDGEDVDGRRPLRVDGHRMHPLMLRTNDVTAGSLVNEVDPVALRTVPNAAGEAGAYGVGILGVLASFFCIWAALYLAFVMYSNGLGIISFAPFCFVFSVFCNLVDYF